MAEAAPADEVTPVPPAADDAAAEEEEEEEEEQQQLDEVDVDDGDVDAHEPAEAKAKAKAAKEAKEAAAAAAEAAAAARPAGKKRAREGESSHSDALYSGQVYDVDAGCAACGLDSSEDEADEMDEAADDDDAYAHALHAQGVDGQQEPRLGPADGELLEGADRGVERGELLRARPLAVQPRDDRWQHAHVR